MNQETISATSEPAVATDHFHTLFPTTARGAHTARHAVECWLSEQSGWPQPDDDSTAAASLLIAELTANAARHGRVRGRNVRLALTLTSATLRIEVTDAGPRARAVALARGVTVCPYPRPQTPMQATSSAGALLLVAALADAWGCEAHHPGGKTVWAKCARREPALKGGV
ncbi:ATP-binding protein [Streptomyces sp. NPDC056337]|uniref:ATP-binding protein n=1 Tax=Streptomyces sp. NPDC056337 TaxID=3345787 RepID=UPI0035E057EE